MLTASRDDRGERLDIRKCRLAVLSGPDAGATATFESPTIRVGRNEACGLALADARVSAWHFEVCIEADGYRLRDLESKNGTFVAGHRIFDAIVQPNTVVELGETKIRLEALTDTFAVPLSDVARFGDLVGATPVMRILFARLERIAATDTTVLITGETGAGKEVCADAIHRGSPRADAPFVVVDCGALPAGLVEDELFGHERGSFTGALAPRPGAFERAHGGTILLDEIGELSLDLQPKLLGVLERREVQRVGGSRQQAVDVRVIASTNRDLAVDVNRGRFRADLYYRLAVAMIKVPPLRARKQDIPLLVESLLATLPGGEAVELSPETIRSFLGHDWPGNVRELRNALERLVLLDEPGLGQAAEPIDAGTKAPATGDGATDVVLPYRRARREFERHYLDGLLRRHGGNVTAAARTAGVDRMTLHRLLRRLGMEIPGRD